MASTWRKWLRADGPNIVPLRVRTFGAFHWLWEVSVSSCFGLDFWLASLSWEYYWECAARLYCIRETNLVPDEVTKITNVIMASGDSRSLNRRERHSLLVVSLESGIFGVLIGLLSFRSVPG